MVRRIFLDSRFWIALAEVHYGKEDDVQKIQAYKKIKKVSDSGECIFPFSMFKMQLICVTDWIYLYYMNFSCFCGNLFGPNTKTSLCKVRKK